MCVFGIKKNDVFGEKRQRNSRLEKLDMGSSILFETFLVFYSFHQIFLSFHFLFFSLLFSLVINCCVVLLVEGGEGALDGLTFKLMLTLKLVRSKNNCLTKLILQRKGRNTNVLA